MSTTHRASSANKATALFVAALTMSLLGACSSTSKTPVKAPIAYLQANTGGDSMSAERNRAYVLGQRHQKIPTNGCLCHLCQKRRNNG